MNKQALKSTVWVMLGTLALSASIWFVYFAESRLSG